MKHLIYIFSIILISSAISFPQEKKQSQTITQPGIEKQISGKDSVAAKFIDANGDGINDLRQRQGMKKRRGRMDNFIDKDGDGINDNRCEGLGWSSKGKGHGKGSGRHSGKR